MRSLALFPDPVMGKFRWPRSHSELSLFGHGPKNRDPRPPTFSRETILVLGAVADLHQKLGWPRELIEVETANYAFDFAAFEQIPGRGDRMVIAGEAKRSVDEAVRWLSALRVCMMLGDHEVKVHALEATKSIRTNAHKKWQQLTTTRPDHMWIVAPGSRRAFRMSYPKDMAEMAETGSAPKAFRRRHSP